MPSKNPMADPFPHRAYAPSYHKINTKRSLQHDILTNTSNWLLNNTNRRGAFPITDRMAGISIRIHAHRNGSAQQDQWLQNPARTHYRDRPQWSIKLRKYMWTELHHGWVERNESLHGPPSTDDGYVARKTGAGGEGPTGIRNGRRQRCRHTIQRVFRDKTKTTNPHPHRDGGNQQNLQSSERLKTKQNKQNEANRASRASFGANRREEGRKTTGGRMDGGRTDRIKTNATYATYVGRTNPQNEYGRHQYEQKHTPKRSIVVDP